MSSGLHSVEAVRWESSVWRASARMPGVRFRVRRPSLSARGELTRRVRGLLEELAFQAAGETPSEKLAAVQLQVEADRTYIEWGVLELEGLELDGSPATVASCVERGPELLCREMAEAVREELTLNELERKN